MKEQTSPGKDAETVGQARHGYRNEVNWEGGSGRQPYSNQGKREMPSPGAAHAVPEGNRGAKSGTTVDQLAQVKQKP